MNPCPPRPQPLHRRSPSPRLSLGFTLAVATAPLLTGIARAADRASTNASTNAPNPLLTVERIFKGGEFGGEGGSAAIGWTTTPAT